MAERLFGARIQQRARQAVRALDDSRDTAVSGGRALERDRWDGEREEVLQQALNAWRVNPLARRIVELTSQYVVGGGIGLECDHAETLRLLRDFWQHRLNRMDHRVFELCDELTRSGELFVLLSTDASGMSYVRGVPALAVREVETAANDLEQPRRFVGRDGEESWAAYDPALDDGQRPVMLHYAINRPVGALRGESDLAPLLRWLGRYAAWLEDRARLNRFRFAFVYAVTMRGASEADRRRRQAELTAAPPAPGSVLVKDESEDWEVLSPKLEAAQAGEDGLALKKMISAGAGVPLHFLAEPESSTRTTAESAGGPTFRHYEQRQEYFLWLLGDLLRVVVERAARAGRAVDPGAQIRVHGADVSARDNAALAVAASTAVSAFSSLRDRALIDDGELLRLAYRFAGEVVDVEAMLARGKRAGARAEAREDPRETARGPRPGIAHRPAGAEKVEVDGESGAVKGGSGAARWEGQQQGQQEEVTG
jgi:hypothetical protein